MGEGSATIDALVDEFKLHRRLITQAVVALVQDGFVALGGVGDAALLPTREGEAAVTRGVLARTVVVPGRKTTVVMERLAGSLAPNTEVRFIDERDVRDVYRESPKLAARVVYNDLDGAQVRHLLPRAQGEWLQHVGRITQLSKGSHWLPVDADVDAGAVIGLPDRWTRSLKSVILDAASGLQPGSRPIERARPLPQRRRPVHESEEASDSQLPPEAPVIDVSATDVLADEAEWQARVRGILDGCRGTVLVATPEIDPASVALSADELTSACDRGVHISIVWGRDAGGGLEALKKLRFDTGNFTRLDFNQVACPTAAMLVAAIDDDEAVAMIGGVGYLSRVIPDGLATLALVLHDASIISAACTAVSGAWRAAADESFATGPDHINRIAAQLEARAVEHPASSASGVPARLVLDRDHELVLSAALVGAAQRITLLSSNPSAVAPTRIVALMSTTRGSDFELCAMLGSEPSDPAVANQLRALIRAQGGTLTIRPGSGCALLTDDVAVIGSFDPLGTEPYDTSRGVRHLSLEVRSKSIVDVIQRELLGGAECQ